MWKPEVFKRAGLSPRHLRLLAGFPLSRQTYWSWLSGRATPPASRQQKLYILQKAVEQCVEQGELPITNKSFTPDERFHKIITRVQQKMGEIDQK